MDWLFSISNERWLDIISKASLLFAAGFGLLGLLTDYKKDGKITRWGKIAAAGIVASAVLSIAAGFFKDRVEAAAAVAAKAQRTLEADRFDVQLGQLKSLNLTMSSVNRRNTELLASAQRSLSTQDRLLTSQGSLLSSARRSMLLTTGLTAQERANTGRVLTTMWQESTRVGGSGIMLAVTYGCAPVEGGREFPRLIAENAFADLRVAPIAAARALGRPLDSFASTPLMHGEEVVTLGSYDQQVSVNRASSVDGDEVMQLSRFGPFYAEKLSQLERPESWEGKAIEVTIRGFHRGLVAAADAAMPEEAAGGKEELRRRFSLPVSISDNQDYQVAVLPCWVGMKLFVNGRLVGQSAGDLVQLGEGDEDRRGLVVVKFPIIESGRNLFPRFSGR